LQQKAREYFHRSEQQRWEDFASGAPAEFTSYDLSDEEIEMELMQRKEAIKGGLTS
jgi:hypothetical protein